MTKLLIFFRSFSYFYTCHLYAIFSIFPMKQSFYILFYVLFACFASNNNLLRAQVDTVVFATFAGQATTEGVQLNWSTQAEYNVQTYTVERSLDAILFDSVANITPDFNNPSTKFYDFNDLNVYRAYMYYRIAVKMTNKTTYSEVVAVNRQDIEQLPDFKIYPTITHQYINLVKITEDVFDNAVVRIVDFSGRSVYEKKLESNFLFHTFDLSSYNAGAYILEFTDGQFSYKSKFIKQY